MNINNFEGKVKVKFVFTFYFMGFCQYTLSYSTLKSFVFGRFFKNILPGKLKWESYLPILAVLNMLKPAQDKGNRTGHFLKMATQ